MVRGKRIDASLDVGEILLEQRRHVGVQPLLDALIGSRPWPRSLALLLP
jgi:hypothetical protein